MSLPKSQPEYAAVTERFVNDGDKFHVVQEQNIDDIIAGVKQSRDVVRKGADQHYLGSVPLVVAQIWAKECGAPFGTREFLAYARKQLKSPDNAHFRADLGTKVHTVR